MAEVSELLFRKSSRAILRHLSGGPLTLTQLSSAVGSAKPTVLRAIEPLVREGFVIARDKETPVGREREYEARAFSLHWSTQYGVNVEWCGKGNVPFRHALTCQIPAEDVRSDVIRIIQAVEDLGAVRFIILFGSTARGEQNWKSDIDVLFLLTGDPHGIRTMREHIRGELADPDLSLTRRYEAFFETVADFLSADKPVIRASKEDGIVVYGDPDPGKGAGGVEVWHSLQRYKPIST